MNGAVNMISYQIPVKVSMDNISKQIQSTEDEVKKAELQDYYNDMNDYVNYLDNMFNDEISEYGPDMLYDLIENLNESLDVIINNKELLQYKLEQMQSFNNLSREEYDQLLTSSLERLSDMESGIEYYTSSIKSLDKTRDLKRKNIKQLVLRKDSKRYED